MATPGVQLGDSSPVAGIGGRSGGTADPFDGIEAGSSVAEQALGIKQNAVGRSHLVGIVSGLIDVANRTLRGVIDSLSK